MPRENINLANLDLTNPDNVAQAILQLRADFDAHNHDGFNSRSLDNLEVQSLLAAGLIGAGAIYIPNIVSPLFSVDVNGNVMANSLQRNDFHWLTLFESITGYTTSGTITNNGINVSVVTGNVSGNTAKIQKTIQYNVGEFSWNKSRKIKTSIFVNQITAQHIYFITGEATTSAPVDRGFGFQLVNDEIRGYCADGSARSVTAALSTYSGGDSKSFEARLIYSVLGSKIEFYVNGFLLATLTTNIPTGTTFANIPITIFSITDENVAKTVALSYWDFWQAN